MIILGIRTMATAEPLSCEFCSKIFKTRGNLKRHQTTAIYCLQNQGDKRTRKQVLDIADTFNCDYCSKEFMLKANLKTHQDSCSSKSTVQRMNEMGTEPRVKEVQLVEKEKTIDKLEIQIVELKAQIADLINKQHSTTLTAITRPSTNVKNTIKTLQVNNLTPLLTEEMLSHIPMLTRDHFEAGAAGLAQYAVEYPLKDKVIVTDASRRKLRWKNETGAIVEDLEGVELCKKFFEVHREQSRSKISELMKELIDRHNAATDAEDEEEIKLCDERMCKLHELRRGILRLSRGDVDELRTDFVKEVCVKLNPAPSL